MQGIQALIGAAPEIEKIVAAAKAFIAGLFGAGAITIAEQNALHLQIDTWAAMWASGITPPAWTVEPDPAS